MKITHSQPSTISIFSEERSQKLKDFVKIGAVVLVALGFIAAVFATHGAILAPFIGKITAHSVTVNILRFAKFTAVLLLTALTLKMIIDLICRFLAKQREHQHRLQEDSKSHIEMQPLKKNTGLEETYTIRKKYSDSH